VYLVTRADVIPPRVSALNALLVDAGMATFTLVACHPPGSTVYRLAITGRLIGLA
jgi:sortase (surface protein transpeptidase)